MSTDNLLRRLREHQVAHLRAGVDSVQRLKRVCIPKANVSVGSTAAGRKQAVLMWGPADGFHCGSVFSELYQRFVRVQVPDH